mmetsp:Transcript_11505/g.25211  ORF Transcript_11505/g.25211 Transcript_11505/m.25211 type:complete len:456 (-) Transcript_11505:115-1482(-)
MGTIQSKKHDCNSVQQTAACIGGKYLKTKRLVTHTQSIASSPSLISIFASADFDAEENHISTVCSSKEGGKKEDLPRLPYMEKTKTFHKPEENIQDSSIGYFGDHSVVTSSREFCSQGDFSKGREKIAHLNFQINNSCNSNLETNTKAYSIETFTQNNNPLKKNAKHEGLFQLSSCKKMNNSEENKKDMREVINPLESSKQTYQNYSFPFSGPNFIRRKGRGHAVQFPEKLYTMLEAITQENLLDVVAWADHGQAFYIHRPKQFEQVMLHLFFNNIKWTSFRRQLNLYGFKLVRKGTYVGCYYHKLFLRGRPEFCSRIKRIEKEEKAINIPSNSKQLNVHSILSSQQTKFAKVHKGMHNDNRELLTNIVETKRSNSVQEVPLQIEISHIPFHTCTSTASTTEQIDHKSLNLSDQLVGSKFKEQIVEKDINNTLSSVKQENDALHANITSEFWFFS